MNIHVDRLVLHGAKMDMCMIYTYNYAIQRGDDCELFNQLVGKLIIGCICFCCVFQAGLRPK